MLPSGSLRIVFTSLPGLTEPAKPIQVGIEKLVGKENLSCDFIMALTAHFQAFVDDS